MKAGPMNRNKNVEKPEGMTRVVKRDLFRRGEGEGEGKVTFPVELTYEWVNGYGWKLHHWAYA